MLARNLRFVCTLGAALALLSLAQPQAAPGLAVSGLSGSPNRGEILNISGNGFGTKPVAAPLKFDSFETGANNVDIGNGWSTSGGNKPRYSSTVRRSNSQMSVRARFDGGAYGSSFGVSGTPLSQIYLDAWYYLDAAAPFSRNHKIFRLHANIDLSPNLYYNLYCAGIGSSHLSQDGVNGNFHTWLGQTAQTFSRKWSHIQAYFKASSAGVDDGTSEMWIDGEKVVDMRGSFRTRESGQGLWDTLWLGNYFSHEADGSCPSTYGDAYTYWDDVYVDTSRARVEIGDSSSYNGARHREIQNIQSWSNNSVSIVYNPGTFTSTNGLYLFVIDDQGNVSPGYALGAASTTTPATPRNLRVLPGE